MLRTQSDTTTQFTLSAPKPNTKRRSGKASQEEIEAAQTLRAELETRPSVSKTVCVAAGDEGTADQTDWVITDGVGEIEDWGDVGRFFGQHHTLQIAIGRAVKRAAEAEQGMETEAHWRHEAYTRRATRLTVRVSDSGFGWVNRVGTRDDDGRGGKTRKLALRAMKAGVLLIIEYTLSLPNPAADKTGAFQHFAAEIHGRGPGETELTAEIWNKALGFKCDALPL